MESNLGWMLEQRWALQMKLFDGSNDLKLEGLLIGDSLVYTDGKVLVSGEGTKLGLFYVELFDTILGNVDGITLGLDIRTDLGS